MKKFGIVPAMVAVLGVATAANADFINGNFETSPDPGSWIPLATDSNTISPWIVSGSDPNDAVDLVGTLWEPYDGDKSVDLNGSTNGFIEQAVATVPGEWYEITFALSGNPGRPGDKSMRVSADLAFADFVFTQSNDPDNMMWELNSWKFQATDDSTLVRFESTTPVGLYGCGAVLDAASITHTVPGPGHIFLDIMPGSCPNPLDVKDKKDVLDVSILGTADFDVMTMNFDSILLSGVAPVRYAILEDVATPVGDGAGQCECTSAGPDGYLDLTLKFDVPTLVAALGTVYDGDVVSLTLTGVSREGCGESPIEGKDCVVIVKGDKP